MLVKDRMISTFLWGFILWFIGYIAGILLFFVVPKDLIGWVLTPLATLFTIWVLMKKIKRPEMQCYIGLGIVWTIMAVILDYLFLVKLFKADNYYKPDVFLYYFLTFALPIVVGYWKYTRKPAKSKIF